MLPTRRQPGPWRRVATVMVAATVAAAAAACAEKLEGGAACPLLCPEQSVDVRDTVVDALAFDSSVVGYPTPGAEPHVLVATRGDSLDVRGILRFDSLPSRFVRGGDSAITRVDSVRVRLRLDRQGSRLTAPVVLQAFDVDTTAADTALAALVPLFRPERLIGQLRLVPDSLADTVFVPLNSAAVLDKITGGKRLRIGLRAAGGGPVQLRFVSQQGGAGPQLSYRATPDTAVKPITVGAISRSPSTNATFAGELADYTLVVRGTAPPPADAIAVGGLPARRGYLRFALPARIVDSSTVLRATLLLTQRPNRAVDPRDSITVYPQLVTAGTVITDIVRAVAFLAPVGSLDSLRVAPADSGQRSVEIAAAVRAWRAQGATGAPRAIVLRAGLEGSTAQQIVFFSGRAPAGLRPRVRLSYVPRAQAVIP